MTCLREYPPWSEPIAIISKTSSEFYPLEFRLVPPVNGRVLEAAVRQKLIALADAYARRLGVVCVGADGDDVAAQLAVAAQDVHRGEGHEQRVLPASGDEICDVQLDALAVFDERAQEVVALLDAGDYETLQSMSIDEMKAGLNAEMMEQAREITVPGDWGAFGSFGNAYATEISQSGQVFDVVEVVAVYEKATVTYGISFLNGEELAGIRMR